MAVTDIDLKIKFQPDLRYNSGQKPPGEIVLNVPDRFEEKMQGGRKLKSVQAILKNLFCG
ncbi:hypothetical protein VQ7734_00823 [Vibrio quintilis]|uniref:Uncharacterized protein n=1 Tax=Vibrio quintilis TaxID=1117707 RepID=A0A1M7YR60_9VIBR|nr:hypothetical protein VQ7734_00823 [Vibrio quintilis]